jgi:hypothetical protein
VNTKRGPVGLSVPALASGVTGSLPADYRMPKLKVPMETCMQAALAKHAGAVVKLELKVTKRHSPRIRRETHDATQPRPVSGPA